MVCSIQWQSINTLLEFLAMVFTFTTVTGFKPSYFDVFIGYNNVLFDVFEG